MYKLSSSFQITPTPFATKDWHAVREQLFYSLYTYHRRSQPSSLFLITIITILSVQYKEISVKTIQENLLHYLQILNRISFYCQMYMFLQENHYMEVSVKLIPLPRNYNNFCSPLAENILTYSYSKLFVNTCIIYVSNGKELLRILWDFLNYYFFISC